MSWELLWKFVFVMVLFLFAVMSVLVTIRGARDIRKLLAAFQREEAEQSEKPRSPSRS